MRGPAGSFRLNGEAPETEAPPKGKKKAGPEAGGNRPRKEPGPSGGSPAASIRGRDRSSFVNPRVRAARISRSPRRPPSRSGRWPALRPPPMPPRRARPSCIRPSARRPPDGVFARFAASAAFYETVSHFEISFASRLCGLPFRVFARQPIYTTSLLSLTGSPSQTHFTFTCRSLYVHRLPNMSIPVLRIFMMSS